MNPSWVGVGGPDTLALTAVSREHDRELRGLAVESPGLEPALQCGMLAFQAVT